MNWWMWRKLVRRLAIRHGFLDPFALLARLAQFAQPSEVAAPIELLRAGAMFHARGLINSRVIQNNLDWTWPYWVCRQFDTNDPAFLPRAFSMTYINLTHRNWVAIGLPDLTELPIVDPRGLVTPFLDSWSLDGWVIAEDDERLVPSKTSRAIQLLRLEDGITVLTQTNSRSMELRVSASVVRIDGTPCCRVIYEAFGTRSGSLLIALRPYNPEGISLVDNVMLSRARDAWQINDKTHQVLFNAPADRHIVSDYRHGDAGNLLNVSLPDRSTINCDAGMATAIACFDLNDAHERTVEVLVPLITPEAPRRTEHTRDTSWQTALATHCRLDIPDARISLLYETALRSLILLSPDEVFPGPFTYRRFWFRDACFMIHALLSAGLVDRARRALDHFPQRQTLSGFFHSQDGEWDSNGQCLWIMQCYCDISGQAPPPGWKKSIYRGAKWLIERRLRAPGKRHDGLLPAGFSAEHFGPNDYYYWDDIWAIAGLKAAAVLVGQYDDPGFREELEMQAADLTTTLMRSLDLQAIENGRAAMPASPYRRLDASAIGCLVAGYPTNLLPRDDPRLQDTAEFLLERYCRHDGFFHDIIHSGINAYLTLELAETLLRAGDSRYRYLLRAIASLASATGQWPEAIHPRTLGGCMGDGQHGWATAEWILLIRNCFIAEDTDTLIFGAGIDSNWLKDRQAIRFGPAPTRFGVISMEILRDAENTHVSWQADFKRLPATIEIRLPDHAPLSVGPDRKMASVTRTYRSCVST